MCPITTPLQRHQHPALGLFDWTLAIVPATNSGADRDVGSGPVVPATAGQACAAAVIAKLDKNASWLDILEGAIKEFTDD